MKKIKTTQYEKVQAHLRKHGAIDNFYCINNKITLRLAAVILNLKEAGWKFDSGFIPGTKNFQYRVK